VSDLISSPLSSDLAVGAHAQRKGPVGVFLQERTNVLVYNVLARNACDEKLADFVAREFGIELPFTARHTSKEALAFVWAGPHKWLAIVESGASQSWYSRLQRSLAGAASVVDQSDGRVILRIKGSKVRDVLAKGVHIDLDPESFKVGDTALTAVAHINVQFWQVDDAPTYDFVMFRSFAAAFCEWLSEAAGEYGFAIE